MRNFSITAAFLLLLLLAHNHRPSLSENEDSEPNLKRDCSWGKCDENEEFDPSSQDNEAALDQEPDTASNQDPSPSRSIKALGPEWNFEHPEASCPSQQVGMVLEHCTQYDKDEHNSLQQAGTPSSLSRFTNLLPNFPKAFSDGAKAVFNTVHRLSGDVLEEIGSIVRTVFSEEAYNFVSDLTQGAINSLFSPEQLLGSTLTSIGLKALTLTIVLTCVLLNYMFLHYLSLLAILTFDCTVFLVHQLLGPEAVAGIFIYIIMRVYHFLSWLISYPYLFAALIVLFFILSCIWPYIRHLFYRSARDIALDIERRLDLMDDRLAGIEEMQQRLLDAVNNIKEKVS